MDEHDKVMAEYLGQSIWLYSLSRGGDKSFHGVHNMLTYKDLLASIKNYNAARQAVTAVQAERLTAEKRIRLLAMLLREYEVEADLPDSIRAQRAVFGQR